MIRALPALCLGAALAADALPPLPAPPGPEVLEACARAHLAEPWARSAGLCARLQFRDVPGLWERLGAVLVRVTWTRDGAWLWEEDDLWREGTWTPVGPSFGGHGVQSAVMAGDVLWFTWSFGSGIHRSHVGCATRMGKGLRLRASDGVDRTDLYVAQVGGRVRVLSGLHEGYGAYEDPAFVGEPVAGDDGVRVLDRKGREVIPPFPAAGGLPGGYAGAH